jgi:hypothetical protein
MDNVVETQPDESARQATGFGAPFGRPFASNEVKRDETADARAVASDGISEGCLVAGQPCGVTHTDK